MSNTRGAKPRTVQALPFAADESEDKALARIKKAADELEVADQLASQQGMLYRLVGRIEAAHFLETVSSRMVGEAYLKARELIGEVGSLLVKDSTGKAKRVSSLEEFCEAVMPVSHRRCQQIAQAMHTLGPALYEQAEQMGLGHRNYAAIRALPNDMQDQVKSVISSGDREQVMTLLQELAARNSSINTEVSELRKAAAAKDRVIAGKDTKINELMQREEMRRAGSPDEREQQQLSELRDAGLRVEQGVQSLAATVDEVMREPATEAAELAARQTVDYVVQRLADALLARGITVDLMGERIDPEWAKAIAASAAKGSKRGAGN